MDLSPTKGNSSLGGGETLNPVTLLRDERSEEGLGKPELKDVNCRGTQKGFPEEGACDLGMGGQSKFARREEGKPFFSREGMTQR